ncbi:MAG TPA: VOC family protein [Hanamia sp.]|nr:VOC family protein [Hanamia sp.]
MNQSIYPCILFDGNAKVAAEFYLSVFPGSHITTDNGIVVFMNLKEQKFMLLNGPQVAVNPSASFMYMTDSPDEVKELWDKLIAGGKELMALDTYPWSSKYGWLQDQFGVSWQLYTGKKEDILQKYTPSLMFTGDQNGRAEEAIDFYTSIFPDSGVQGVLKYGENGGDVAGNVQHAQFHINGYYLMCMDSSGPHNFSFNEGVSIVVECDTQDELDNYWNKLTTSGGSESVCGWLKDKFGFSWQIVPKKILHLMNNGNAEKSGKMMNALMKMKKLDIAQLEAAYNS